MQTTLPYWFAVQQQTSTFTDQKFDFFWAKLVYNLLKLVLCFKSNSKWPKNAKSKIIRKDRYMRHSEPKG